jgi:hypothetical protein
VIRPLTSDVSFDHESARHAATGSAPRSSLNCRTCSDYVQKRKVTRNHAIHRFRFQNLLFLTFAQASCTRPSSSSRAASPSTSWRARARPARSTTPPTPRTAPAPAGCLRWTSSTSRSAASAWSPAPRWRFRGATTPCAYRATGTGESSQSSGAPACVAGGKPELNKD